MAMQKTSCLVLGAAALASVAATPVLANLVTDGSFDAPGSKLGQFNAGGGDSAWTVTGTNAGGSGTTGYAFIFDNSSAFTTGSPGQFGNVALWPGPGTTEGTRFYGVDSTFHPSVLRQTITGLTPGEMYDLTFDWAAGQQMALDGSGNFSGVTTDQFKVQLGSGPAQFTPVVTVPSHGFVDWMPASMVFVASAATQTLSFTDIGTCVTNPDSCGPTVAGGPPFSLLDSVSLVANPVPEPSTYALMLLGFAGLGYAAFRRRSGERRLQAAA